MILKSFEIEKIDLKKIRYYLLYGQNEGHKNQIIKEKFKKEYSDKTYSYEEADVLKNLESFYDNVLSKSFFENEKLVIINRATDKINDIIEEIVEKNIDDLVIVLNSSSLEKKSKLRSFFEKNKKTICVPFYEDNDQTLSGIASKFFRSKKITISQQVINLIAGRCRGDRQNLYNELEKIKNFAKDKKKIEVDDILKLTNLAENYDASELIDSCLSKNKKKTLNILNENNYSHEDCIMIIRTFLMKSKRLSLLCKQLEKTKNIDSIVASYKPPIFWKDKEVVKQQIRCWSYNDATDLIYEINDIELLIKKYSNNSINILLDFIIEKTSTASNSL